MVCTHISHGLDCLQCESYPAPGRMSLEVSDWFIKGGSIHDILPDGFPISKLYGEGMPWTLVDIVPVELKSKTKFLIPDVGSNHQTVNVVDASCGTKSILHYVSNNTVLQFLATSVANTIQHHPQTAKNKRGEIYRDEFHLLPKGINHCSCSVVHSCGERHIPNNLSNHRMKVLSDNGGGVSLENCLPFEMMDGCMALVEYIKTVFSPSYDYQGDFAGTFHLQCDNQEVLKGDSQLVFFEIQGHKSVFDFVTFVPLRSSFWILVAIWEGYTMFGDLQRKINQSMQRFATFRTGLGKVENTQIDSYIQQLRERLQSMNTKQKSLYFLFSLNQDMDCYSMPRLFIMVP